MWEPNMSNFSIQDIKDYTGITQNSFSALVALSSSSSSTMPAKGSLPGHFPYGTVAGDGNFLQTSTSTGVGMNDMRGLTFAIGSSVISGSYGENIGSAACQASIAVEQEVGMVNSYKSGNTIRVTTSYNGRISSGCTVSIVPESFMVSYYTYYQTNYFSCVVDNNADSNGSFTSTNSNKPSLGSCAAYAHHVAPWLKNSTHNVVPSKTNVVNNKVYCTIYVVNRNR